MSRELRTLRAMYDAFSQGDFAAAARYLHPDAEVHPALEPLEQGGKLRGRDAVRQFFESLGIWESRRVEFEEVIEADDRVLVVERWHVRASQGLELNFELTDVYTFREGLIVRCDGFRERTDALEAVGLSDQAMSRENVELVRRVYELFNRRDIEGVLGLGAVDFELRLPDIYPEGPETFRGRNGLQRWTAMVEDVWGEWRFDVERLIDADDQVLALVRIVAEGGASGVPVDREVAHVWSIQDGKASTVSVYLDRAEALEAVGMRD